MCSIVMPADYEMLVSHSPPIFGHSPTSSFMGRYEAYRKPQMCRPFSNRIQSPPSPRRPILVVRQQEDSSSDEESSPFKSKKRVVFADDKGMSLTHIRVMTEPSNVPPLWSMKFLEQVTRGIRAEPVAQQDPWEICFTQPASDYVKFRKTLETNKVSLENVIIKESEELIVGTVKVSNLSYEKEVLIRTTSNQWKTHEDVHCNFVQNTSTNAVYVLYDTFSFKLNFPPKSRAIEFCVCFRCEGKEYWDNNNNHNYKVMKKLQLQDKPAETNAAKTPDFLRAKCNDWGQFASWNHQDDNPYW